MEAFFFGAFLLAGIGFVTVYTIYSKKFYIWFYWGFFSLLDLSVFKLSNNQNSFIFLSLQSLIYINLLLFLFSFFTNFYLKILTGATCFIILLVPIIWEQELRLYFIACAGCINLLGSVAYFLLHFRNFSMNERCFRLIAYLSGLIFTVFLIDIKTQWFPPRFCFFPISVGGMFALFLCIADFIILLRDGRQKTDIPPNSKPLLLPSSIEETPLSSEEPPLRSKEPPLRSKVLLKAAYFSLPAKEQQVVILFVKDRLSVKEIAKRLNLKIETVRSYMKHIYKILGVRSQEELIEVSEKNLLE